MTETVAPRPDFSKQEQTLFEFSRSAIAEFARGRREPFSYFAFDCNPDYGQVLLCLDTLENSRRRAKESEFDISVKRRKDHAYDAPDWELQWAIHALGNDLRGFVVPFGNNTGDFSDQGFADYTFEDWILFAFTQPREFPDSKETRIACLAVILLSRIIDSLVEQNAFACLNLSQPFYVGIGLHDSVQRVVRMINQPPPGAREAGRKRSWKLW